MMLVVSNLWLRTTSRENGLKNDRLSRLWAAVVCMLSTSAFLHGGEIDHRAHQTACPRQWTGGLMRSHSLPSRSLTSI